MALSVWLSTRALGVEDRSENRFGQGGLTKHNTREVRGAAISLRRADL